MANLGVNYKDAGRLAEAIPLLEEAYRAAKKYPHASLGGSAIARRLHKGRRERQARQLASANSCPKLGKRCPRTARNWPALLAQIGMGLLEQKKWAEAEPLLRECLAIREKTQPDSWVTFNTKSMLGGALLGQKKYAEAEPLLLAGYEGMKKREKTIPPQGRSASLKRSNAWSSSTRQPTSPTKPQAGKELEARKAAGEPTGEKALIEETASPVAKSFDASLGGGTRRKGIPSSTHLLLLTPLRLLDDLIEILLSFDFLGLVHRSSGAPRESQRRFGPSDSKRSSASSRIRGTGYGRESTRTAPACAMWFQPTASNLRRSSGRRRDLRATGASPRKSLCRRRA